MSISTKLATITSNTPRVYDAGEQVGEQVGQQVGQQIERDAFWNKYQQNGERTNYQCAFGGKGWTNETFKPRYDIIVEDDDWMFYNTNIAGSLKSILEELGITLSFRGEGATLAYTFQYARQITELPSLNFENATSCTNVFYQCTELKTIDELKVSEKTTFSSNSFNGCRSLENVKFSGTLAKNGLNLQWSNALTHESLMSLINSIADKSSDTSGTKWTITIGSTNKAKLTEEELAIADAKGWVVS